MSLRHELAVFACSYKFIKFISSPQQLALSIQSRSVLDNVHNVHNGSPNLSFQQLTRASGNHNVHPNVHNVHSFRGYWQQDKKKAKLSKNLPRHLPGCPGAQYGLTDLPGDTVLHCYRTLGL
jgi:hypothetical protein